MLAFEMLANCEMRRWDGSTKAGLWLIRCSGEDMHLQAGKQTDTGKNARGKSV